MPEVVASVFRLRLQPRKISPAGRVLQEARLFKRKERFDYATALANGSLIATGIIEAACRRLVKDRMDLTGARRSPDGSEAMPRLRSLGASGDFEKYMAFHHRQERPRNYVSAPQNNDLTLAA